jgi:8-hydroxy-5-deazaflavin:NADPH oxidoreductase
LKIGVIGAGRVGGGLAAMWVRAGHEVIVSGSRDAGALEAVAAGIGARAASISEAGASSEVIVLAVPAGVAKQALAEAGDLSGKILVDCTNDVSRASGDDTLAEELAGIATGTSVVKAFNTAFASLYDDIAAAPGRPDLLFCGDDGRAKEVVAALIRDAGFEPIDAGELEAAAELEDFARAIIRLCYQRGMGPFVYRLGHPDRVLGSEGEQ